MGLYRRLLPRRVPEGLNASGHSGGNVAYLQQPTDGALGAATPSPQQGIDASLGPLRKPTDLLAWREGAERGVKRLQRHRLSEADRDTGGVGRSIDSLRGVEVPAVKVDTTTSTGVSLRALAVHRLVLYAYPGASTPEDNSTRDEDALEHRAYRCCQETLRRRQVRVVALSSQTREAQTEEWHAHKIGHTMFRDPTLELADSLGLPIILSGGERCYGRATLIIEDQIIQHIFCPVKRAAANPAQVLAWMAIHGW
jgi:peroxiredoxin